MAAGNPVIANIDEGKYPIITKYGCGKVVKAGSSEEYAKGIEYFINMNDTEMTKYRENAQKTALLFDTEQINGAWLNVIRKRIKREG